jgi:GNAT superfamily N-acetyltransferase
LSIRQREENKSGSVSPISVSSISAADTIGIRWEILRPGFPRETAVFAGDDSPTARHFGGFINGRLAGVASIYQVPCPDRPDAPRAWQLRGMATLPEVRGLGVGKALVAACEQSVRDGDDSFLWCNARIGAVDFYAHLGWLVSSDEFDIPTVGPHRRMLRVLAPSNPA